jgi:hypothetical protein
MDCPCMRTSAGLANLTFSTALRVLDILGGKGGGGMILGVPRHALRVQPRPQLRTYRSSSAKTSQTCGTSQGNGMGLVSCQLPRILGGAAVGGATERTIFQTVPL